ncbi:GCN5-related N-acetyltransferase 5, chloroplastic-like [Hevea brasiliensis]|uniref:GCN5-related N-acetyltransferase 5, chloroplastic-like n=1 Tax=Hevea brasiliensis TaxID=3981 RepID=UPI0025FD9360|nr:GCN5-related N-acetyltransferase 5, chloroplastic-like [Hevea brasiliensis]
MWVRVMRPEVMDITLWGMCLCYLIDSRSVMPHAVTLVGFYRGKHEGDGDGEEEEEELPGAVEVCFDKKGANASPPTPTPPKNYPYICNMTVKEPLR